MNITPNRLTIAQLFAQPNEQFLVPSYQRRYAWGYQQYLALFEDIDMLKDNDGHLFGMIILHASYHTGGLNKPELVDGQQRMTTLIILLKALETIYRKKKMKDKADEIKKMVLCKGLDEKYRPKIILGELDNPDIIELLMNNSSAKLSNKRIQLAFDDYCNWLMDFTVEQLNKFFYKLTNIAVIIRLDVLLPQDAYKLFETINNRGLKLKPTDIIKNFLLGHAAKIGDEDILEKVKKIWSRIIVNLDELDTDDFLRHFMCSILRRKVTMSGLVYEFKNYYLKNIERAELLGEYEYYQDEDLKYEEDEETTVVNEPESTVYKQTGDRNKTSIEDFLKGLETLSFTYRKISFAKHESQKISRRLANLNNILSKPAYIFLMHFLDHDSYLAKEKLSVLKYIETLMLRRHTCERRTSENDDIFAKLLLFIGEENILAKIKESIALDEHMPSDADFEIYLPKYQFKGKVIDRAKYILEYIEYDKRKNTEELMLTSSEEVHLEHIIPQTINTKKSKDEFGDWESYLGENSLSKHKKYVNYIGNMTLLGEALNIQAYNNPFAKKKNSYRKSTLLITNDLADLSDFKFSSVDRRSDAITSLALKIWKG